MSEKAKWVESLWGFTNCFFKLNLKVSAFYLEKQKSFISKKFFLSRCQYQNKKSFDYWPNFQWRFWFKVLRNSMAWKHGVTQVLTEHAFFSKPIYKTFFLFLYINIIYENFIGYIMKAMEHKKKECFVRIDLAPMHCSGYICKHF